MYQIIDMPDDVDDARRVSERESFEHMTSPILKIDSVSLQSCLIHMANVGRFRSVVTPFDSLSGRSDDSCHSCRARYYLGLSNDT